MDVRAILSAARLSCILLTASAGGLRSPRLGLTRTLVAFSVAWPLAQSWGAKPQAADDTSPRPIAVAGDGYVTSDACRQCHPHQYDTWHRSYHRTMTQVVSPGTFMGTVGETVTLQGDTYGVERRGDEFWGFQIAGGRRAEKQIVMTTGSHHMQVCWFAAPQDTSARRDGYQDRTLGQFPLVFLDEAKRWVPRNAVFLQPPLRTPPPNETGRWNMSCIRCHTTHGRPNDWDTRVAEFGIACEACHGPAEHHVTIQQNPNIIGPRPRREERPDVVNPSHLDVRAGAQVCGQCHGVWALATEQQVEQWNHRGFPYRPGKELHAHRVTYQADTDLDSPQLQAVLRKDPGFVRDAFWSDGMVRVSGREYNGLLNTPCFQAGELNCLHCHTMHKPEDDPRSMHAWANDQLTLGMDGDQACTQCHENYREAAQVVAHTHHPAESSGSRCYNCHMPYTTYGLLKAIRSHQINTPDVRDTVATGRPNACNQCHLDKSMGWAAKQLWQWYGTEQPGLDPQQETIAASVLWATRGDAGQRALTSWSFGWQTALETSGKDWIAPFLTLLIADRYDAVRYIAGRSLQRLPGYDDFEFDFLAPPTQLVGAQERALKIWKSQQQGDQSGRERLLIDARGNLDFNQLQALMRDRDTRPVFLAE